MYKKESTYLKGAAVSGKVEVGGTCGGGGLRPKTLMDLFIELKKKKFNHVTILRKFY